MENITAFFDELDSKLTDKLTLKENPYNDMYRIIQGFTSNELNNYRFKIADKLFAMHKDDRPIYGKLLLIEIESKLLEEYFVEETDEYQGISYELYCITNENGENELADVQEIAENCRYFIGTIFELFLDFGVNLLDTAKKLRLINDYNKYTDYYNKGYVEFENRRFGRRNTTEFKYTAQQQIIAIQEMLQGLGINRNNVKKIDVTVFVQFLTGRETGPPEDTRLYKRIWDDSIVNKRNYSKDCNVVANLFNNIGLKDISTKLTNSAELNS